MNTLLVAARQWLFIAVLVVAVITGLAVDIYLLPAGVIVYIAAVVIASRDSELLAAATRKEQRRGLTSPTFLSKIASIEHAQNETERSLHKAGGALAQRLTRSVEPQTRQLVEQAYTLARKGQAIEQYLSRVNRTQLQNQIDQIDLRISNTSDQYTIDQLEGTRKALVEQKESADILNTYIGRINSQLDNILANLNAMPAQIMRMRASDVDASMASDQVARHLSEMNADMQAFVGMLDTALDKTSASAY
jgi:archaellum component FlaC